MSHSTIIIKSVSPEGASVSLEYPIPHGQTPVQTGQAVSRIMRLIERIDAGEHDGA